MLTSVIASDDVWWRQPVIVGGLSPSPPPCLQTAASDGSTQKQIHWVERLTNSLRETIFLWQLPEPAVYVDPRDSVCDFGSSADSHVRQACTLKTEKKKSPTHHHCIDMFLFSVLGKTLVLPDHGDGRWGNL